MDIASHRSVYGVFAEQVELNPAKEWLVYERPDGPVFRWTYAEFLGSVHQAANLLLSLGVGAGDLFAIHLSNHPAHAQLMLAASRVGAVAVPINPISSEDELRYLIGHSGAKAIFTESSALDVARRVAAESGVSHLLVCATGEAAAEARSYDAELAAQSTEAPPGVDSSERVLEILYTSGTTAQPKGVMITNANVLFAAETVRASTGLMPSDRHLITLPLFHGAAQFHGLWPALISGGSVAVIPRFSASRYFEQAITYGATMGAQFAAALRMLLAQPPRPTDNVHAIRNITFAQNLTPEQYVEWHRRFGAALQQLWGMTETVTVPLMSPLTGRRNLTAMGRPILGYDLRIIDEDGADVAPEQPGQLIVRGAPGVSLMAGYLHDPDATAAILRTQADGTWLYSGDVVWADESGFVYFADRRKDLIKRAGHSISTVEIEAVIKRLDGVADACVVGLPDPIRDEMIVAAVVPRADSDLSADAVIAHCAAHLSRFKVPERVVFLDDFARTSVGKVQKHLVREQLLQGTR